MAEILNIGIAQRLREVARLLEEQGANPFRVHAYRHAAETLDRLDRPVTELLEAEGMEGLRKLPGIGESLARSIRDLVKTGRLPMLDRLRGEADPVALLASVPGIGDALARRLHHDLGIDTLEELETAAYDGRLTEIAGIGQKKLAGIIDSLASRLGRVRERIGRSEAEGPAGEPSIGEILDVDREYREKTAAGTLHRIAPRRLNPSGEAWLPVLHTQRDTRHYTAMFSNTARAHEFGKTRDWVILYYDGGRGERQCTVITAQRDPFRGKRIVRGREAECVTYYRAQETQVNRTVAQGLRKTGNV
ncbi:MAG: DNA-binding protein [Nitrospirae bacterium]|nr:DNA-binding protein [Nitrospirota bacterium]